MQTILITGGTGLVGKALTQALVERGYKVIILTRDLSGKQSSPNVSYALWDVRQQSIDLEAIGSADHIVHLAGAGVVEKKWTATYQQEIVDSRVNSSKLLVAALKEHPNKVSSIISTSAMGWYGADKEPGNAAFKETDPPDAGFLGETCRLWESSIEPATALGKRVVKLRVGMVLSNNGGALKEFKKPLLFGVAAILGNGKQVISWIHIEDLCRMYIYAIENENIEGSFNAVAPNPVTNKALTLCLARMVKGKFFIALYVPRFVLKLMMGERSVEVLKSATVSCKKINEAGFKFQYPTIESAIADLIVKK